MKKVINKNLQKTIIFLLIAILLSGCIGFLLFSLLNKESIQTANAETFLSQTQAMNGVDKFISFEFVSSKNVNSKNWTDFVKIKNVLGSVPNCIFKNAGGDRFIIKAPENGYDEGGNYIINLNGASFVQSDIDSSKPFYFSIEHDAVENVVFASNVIEADKNNILHFDGETIKTTNITYSEGDILSFTYFENDVWNSHSVKVTQILSNTNGIMTAMVTTPKEDEVVTQKEIYGTYTLDIPREEIEAQLNDKSVQDALLNSNYVTAVSEVLGELYPKQANATLMGYNAMPLAAVGSSGRTVNKLIPKFEFKWEDNEKKDDYENQLFKLKFIFTWDIKEKQNERTAVKVQLIISIKRSVSTFVSDINGVKNTSTISSTTLGIQLGIVGELDLSIKTDLGKTNPAILYKENLKYLGENNEDYLVEKNYQHKNITQGQKQEEQRRIKENAAKQARNDKRQAFGKMVSQRAKALNESGQVVRIINIMVPICPGVSFSFVFDFIVDINFSGEFGTLHEISWTDESGTIESNGETINYHNEDKVLYGGKIYGVLDLEVKIGLRARAGFTFIGIVTLGIQFEGGVYFEAQGAGSYGWGALKDEELDANPFSFYLESGVYFDISAFAKFDIKIYEKSTSITIYGKKFPFAKPKGTKATEDITNFRAASFVNSGSYLEAGSYLDLDMPEIIINENGYAMLPELYKAKFSFDNGETLYIPLSHSDYVIGGSDFVYFDNGIAYLTDSSVHEFEDIVFAYLIKEDGTIDDNSFFPIRVKKDPIKVESVNVIFGKAGIQSGGIESLARQTYPEDASYQDVTYSVDYVIHNGVKVSSPSIYAYIDDIGTLYADKKLKVDDIIGVKAHATHDDVYSEVLPIRVIKTPVQDVRIIADGFRRDILPNENLLLTPKIYPLEATYPNATLEIVSGSEYGELLADGVTLHAFDTAPVGSEICIVATADGLGSPTYKVTVGKTSIESVSVILSDGTPLEDGLELKQGSSIQLSALSYPAAARWEEVAFTVTRGVAFSSITNNGLLTIEQFAPVGEKVKIICSFDGVNSIEYTFVIVAGDNATDDIPLSTEPIYATGIKIAAVRRAFDGAIINENNKARPGDVLTVDIEFLPFNTTEGNKNFILTVNGINKEYALINGNQITITALNDIYCDNPTFNLRVSTIQNGKEIINDYDTVINIYVPVKNFTIKTTEIQRGQFNDLNILFNKNGFASNKELYLDAYYEITNTSGVTGIYVDFENNKIFIPKFAPAGTTVSGCLYSKDNHDNKIPFLLTVKALDVSGYSFTYGNYTNGIFISNVDSKGRYIPSADNAQLEENCYIHILGKFKSEDPLEYGVETQFAINSNDATIGKTSGLLTIKKDAKGSNTVKYTITFIDGNSTYTKEINVKVFNAVNKVNLTNTMVTSNYTCLYVTSSDSLASSSSDSYSFTTVNRTDYSLTADGYLTIKDKTKNDQPISITFTYSQVYNGNAINVYSTTEELDVKIKTSAAKSSLSEKFVTGNLNTSWTTWRTLETLPTYALDYAMLRSINYTEFCVKYKSFISVVGLVAYEIRLYNVSTKTILQTMPIHEPSNGNNVNRDDLFSVDLSEVDSWDTIEIQIRYRKTGVFWAGEFTLSGQELSFCVE